MSGSARAAILAAIALAGGVARAEGFGASLEPGYTHSETDIWDQRGTATHQTTDLLTERYRLTYDLPITDRLDATAGATLLDERGWTRTDGTWSDAHGRATTYYGRLTLGTPVLSAGVGVDRRDQSALGVSSPEFITQSYTGYATWRPQDLPELDFRASHVDTWDTGHRVQDSTTDSASFVARYGAPRYDLRYLLTWARTSDHLHDFQSTSVDQSLLGTRTDVLFAGRTSTYVSATLQNRNTFTESGGAGATVAQQRLPVAGLSVIETFPATPENVALSPNPALIDGNLTTSASVNVGFGPALAGDRDLRDAGVRFGDLTTTVNTLYLWVDRTLSPEVGRAIAGAIQVYESNDNQTWTIVPLAAVPVPSPVENRIEIAIPEKAVRFLKVTIRPVAAGVTTDPSFRDVLVTELQVLSVVPAALVPRSHSALVTSATALVRTAILRSPDLTHDLSASVSHDSDSPRTRYSLVNGLTLAHKLTPWLSANARGARQDQDSGRGHEGSWEWSAALVGRPFQTAYWTLTYSGKAAEQNVTEAQSPGAPAITFTQTTVSHAVSGLGRADWYEGISTQASAGYSISTVGTRTGQTFQTTGTTTLTPNSVLTFTVGGLYNRSLASAPETGDVLTQFARVDASVSFTPAPALSGAGTISRIVLGARPTTLGTLQLNYFPLRGDLQFGVAYSSTLDTAAQTRTQILTPSLRWNIRRGVSLTSSYTWLKNVAPIQTLVSRSAGATLLITL